MTVTGTTGGTETFDAQNQGGGGFNNFSWTLFNDAFTTAANASTVTVTFNGNGTFADYYLDDVALYAQPPAVTLTVSPQVQQAPFPAGAPSGTTLTMDVHVSPDLAGTVAFMNGTYTMATLSLLAVPGGGEVSYKIAGSHQVLQLSAVFRPSYPYQGAAARSNVVTWISYDHPTKTSLTAVPAIATAGTTPVTLVAKVSPTLPVPVGTVDFLACTQPPGGNKICNDLGATVPAVLGVATKMTTVPKYTYAVVAEFRPTQSIDFGYSLSNFVNMSVL